jgi:hypothetical protein
MWLLDPIYNFIDGIRRLEDLLSSVGSTYRPTWIWLSGSAARAMRFNCPDLINYHMNINAD